jgi:hypothetical protein
MGTPFVEIEEKKQKPTPFVVEEDIVEMRL